MTVAGTHEPRLAHQPRNPFAAVPFIPHPSIGRARAVRRRSNASRRARSPFQQRGVGNTKQGRWALPPRVETSPRHAEHACPGANREAGLVGAHEPEEQDHTAPVSRANQEAALDKVSRSKRSGSFFRRSRDNSPRSATLRLGNPLIR